MIPILWLLKVKSGPCHLTINMKLRSILEQFIINKSSQRKLFLLSKSALCGAFSWSRPRGQGERLDPVIYFLFLWSCCTQSVHTHTLMCMYTHTHTHVSAQGQSKKTLHPTAHSTSCWIWFMAFMAECLMTQQWQGQGLMCAGTSRMWIRWAATRSSKCPNLK